MTMPEPADRPADAGGTRARAPDMSDAAGGPEDGAGQPTAPPVVAGPADTAEPGRAGGLVEPAETGGPAEPVGGVGEPELPLPEAVRSRVIALAAAELAQLGPDEVPVPLRRVARFAPTRRARLGGSAIAAQLAADPIFRQRIADKALEQAGELGAVVLDGVPPAAADPVEVAALAYLGRPTGWLDLVEAARQALRTEADTVAASQLLREAEQRAGRAEHDRAVARVEADKLRDELARTRDELATLRDEVRSLSRSLRETQARERKASDTLAAERGRLARATADHAAEVRRLRAKLAEAETAAGATRQAAKESRQVDDARLWLLLETIGQAAAGLRRELALEPATMLPADLVAGTAAAQPGELATPARALAADDPARLDHLLALPRAHLIVDGYNVTKRGFGEISLERQRNRLVGGLGALAAQTGVEVTVAFDGSERIVGLPPSPRGVRVLFSRKGETADELIRRLVRAEPAGRPIVVISSDREVADGVRRHGAYPLSSDTLLKRLGRG